LGNRGIIERQPTQGELVDAGKVNKYGQAFRAAGSVVAELAKIYFQYRSVFTKAWVEILRLKSVWKYEGE